MKTFKRITIKLIIIFLISYLFDLSVLGQTREPQNIRRVTVTSQYVVENGIRKGESWAINQEIYDSSGRLHTEIDYDWIDHYPHNYKWHTYQDKLKVKTETFQNEKLKQVNEFTYNKDSLIIKNIIKKPVPGDSSLSIYLIINHTYNTQKKPITIEARTPKGKLAYKVTSKYDTNGIEISRKVKVKSGFSPQDSIVSLINIPKYDTLGRLSSQNTTYTTIAKLTIKKHFVYSYNTKGLLSGIKELNEKGEQVKREERVYREKDNRIWQISTYDTADRLVKFIAKRYELYRTRDRRRVEYE